MDEFLKKKSVITFLTILFVVTCCSGVQKAEARIRRYKWEVKYELKSPDCYKKLTITINGRSPGPSIVAREGDTIVVELKNSLFTENVAIHWHGIRQIDTPWMDGTEGVTQCPILPADTFVYKFVVDRVSFYFFQQKHISIILYTMILCALYAITVVPGKTYRLRIGSLTALSALSFEIEGHNMTVMEADGHYVEPFTVKNLFIYSGETYSVLVTADQDPSRNYWISAKIVSRNSNTTNGLAILNYYPNHPRRDPPTTPPAGPHWDDRRPRLAQSAAIRARRGFIHPPPQVSDRTIVMLNTQNSVGGYRRWSINNVSFNMPHTPYLIAYKHNLLDAFDQRPLSDGHDFATYNISAVQANPNATTSNAAYRLKFNTTVDIILQNANTMNPNNSETHPWHLHGHDFWVLGYGVGKFNATKDAASFNLVDPIMKNTVVVHPFGWTALRFRADNPGVWAFHCHIESHFFMGMGVVFEEGVERVGELPSSIMGCGQNSLILLK
ncbi:L-ascorbate oxidase-like [Salvia hispanica]|uniref:L-ascorbate oxidase-like n=1 Tax=Salvia hispanica TaxID=49212 RepID=UPI0020097AEC|nr:L-ascorbate oxidase-like [Salvia hispanica]